MDHLILPQSSHSTPIKVKCVCLDDELYDKHDFATFPARREWPELLGTERGHPYWITSAQQQVDSELMHRREKILQAWICFGLLYEILSTFSLHHDHEYIDTEEATGVRWLHTRNLNDRITQWHSAMKTLGASRKEALLTHYRACLTLAVESLRLLNQPNHQSFDHMIKVCLIATCNTVKGMILSQLGEDVYSFQPEMHLGNDLLDRKMMLDNGWCPYDISLVDHQHSLSFSALWYLQHMPKLDAPDSHSDCTNEMCQLSQVSGKLSPRHVEASCQCDSLGPSLDDIQECLRAGDIPVLEIQGEDLENMQLVVHPLSSLDGEETSYVAISHVWADGLGNTENTSLPSCQVQRLNNLIHAMQQHTFYTGKENKPYVHRRRVMLWCDTLCVPVALEHKALAMGKMRDVYLQAAFVLVLDKELERYAYSNIGLLEAGWRITLSRYMRRLWTYQEAGLAKKLIVQFADMPVDILPIMKAGSQMYQASPVRDFLYMGIAASLATIRSWLHVEPRTAWIKEAAMGLCHRRVSYIADEPICISTVLGLDNERLTLTEPSHRVEMLWSLISHHEFGICESVIFNTLDRLTTPGYRWAPSSFLQPIDRPLDYVSVPRDSRPGVLTAQGLRVRRSAWRLKPGRLPGRLPDGFWPDFEGSGASALVQHSDGTWYNVFRAPNQDSEAAKRSILQLIRDDSKEWYLILQRPETQFENVPWASQQSGLLVSKETSPYGLTYYQTQKLVVVDRVRRHNEVRRSIDFIYGRSVQDSWTLSGFNLIVVVEYIVMKPVAWLPTSLQTSITSVLNPAFKRCGGYLANRLRTMILTHKTEAPKLPEVAKLLQDPEADTFKGALGSELVQAFMGRYVEVIETFDAETEWCVD